MPNHQLSNEIIQLLSAKTLLSNNTLFELYKERAEKAGVKESVGFLEDWIKLNNLQSQLQGFIKRSEELKASTTLNDLEQVELKSLGELIIATKCSMQDFMRKIYETYINDTLVTNEQDIKLNLQSDTAARKIYNILIKESQNNLFNFDSFEAVKDIILKLLEQDDYKRFVKTLPFKEFLKKMLVDAITYEAKILMSLPHTIIENWQKTLKLLNDNPVESNKYLRNILSSKSMGNIRNAISSLKEYMEDPLQIIELTNLECVMNDKRDEFIWTPQDIQELVAIHQFKQKFLEKLKQTEDIVFFEYQRIHALEKKKGFSNEIGVAILCQMLNQFLIELGTSWRHLMIISCQDKISCIRDIVTSLSKALGTGDTQKILASIQKSQNAIEEKLNLHLKQLGSHTELQFEEFKMNFLRWTASCKNILDREKECQILFLSRKHRRDGSKLKTMIQAGMTEKFAKTVKNKPTSRHKSINIDPFDLIDLTDQMIHVYSTISKSRSILTSSNEAPKIASNNDTNVKISSTTVNDLSRSRSNTDLLESKMSFNNNATTRIITPVYIESGADLDTFDRILTLYNARKIDQSRSISGSLTERKTNNSNVGQEANSNNERTRLYAHRRHSVIILDQSIPLVPAGSTFQDDKSKPKKPEL